MYCVASHSAPILHKTTECSFSDIAYIFWLFYIYEIASKKRSCFMPLLSVNCISCSWTKTFTNSSDGNVCRRLRQTITGDNQQKIRDTCLNIASDDTGCKGLRQTKVMYHNAASGLANRWKQHFPGIDAAPPDPLLPSWNWSSAT